MRNKVIIFLFFVVCAGAFTAPAAYAGGEEKPLSIAVWLDSGFLHVLAEDETDIAAIYVNQKRLEYPVNGLSVRALDYADATRRLAVYAADKSGNLSNTATLYISDDANAPNEMPTSKPKPFTPDGSASVMDNAVDDGKEFFTITTARDNIFYLIIDRQRESDNVYFLNPVTEEDLLALVDPRSNNENPETPTIVTPSPTEESPLPTAEAVVEPDDKEAGGVDPRVIAALILIGLGFVAGYYVVVIRPKQKNHTDYDREDDADEDDELDDGFDYDDDEIPYEKPDEEDTFNE